MIRHCHGVYEVKNVRILSDRSSKELFKSEINLAADSSDEEEIRPKVHNKKSSLLNIDRQIYDEVLEQLKSRTSINDRSNSSLDKSYENDSEDTSIFCDPILSNFIS